MAKISFNAPGESALAARFANAQGAAAALNRYGSFFQFAKISGSDARGWTARRFNGQGEWNHVVVAGDELYAWRATRRQWQTHRRLVESLHVQSTGVETAHHRNCDGQRLDVAAGNVERAEKSAVVYLVKRSALARKEVSPAAHNRRDVRIALC